jgi:HPt (histidine-containing phosphotransfer) domain-containing protein
VLERLCEVFCRSVPIALHDARDALAAGDAARLERIAHTLVGTLGGFSPPAMELAAAIEDAAAAGAVAPCAALIERLSAMTAELVEAARSLPETLLGD